MKLLYLIIIHIMQQQYLSCFQMLFSEKESALEILTRLRLFLPLQVPSPIPTPHLQTLFFNAPIIFFSMKLSQMPSCKLHHSLGILPLDLECTFIKTQWHVFKFFHFPEIYTTNSKVQRLFKTFKHQQCTGVDQSEWRPALNNTGVMGLNKNLGTSL